MASFDWKGTISAVAPALATALGGPLAGIAVQQISTAVLGKPDGKEAEVAQALSAGGPELLEKLKQADNEFAEKMAGLNVDLEKIAAELTFGFNPGFLSKLRLFSRANKRNVNVRLSALET